MKQTKKKSRLTHTYDTYAHANVIGVYMMILLQHYSSVATCRGYTSTDYFNTI